MLPSLTDDTEFPLKKKSWKENVKGKLIKSITTSKQREKEIFNIYHGRYLYSQLIKY